MREHGVLTIFVPAEQGYRFVREVCSRRCSSPSNPVHVLNFEFLARRITKGRRFRAVLMVHAAGIP